MNKKHASFLFILLLLFIYTFAFLLIKDKSLFVDEYQHYASIKEIANLNIGKDTFLRNANFPGYFLTIGLLDFAFKNSSVFFSRFISAIFSFLSVLVFYFVAKELNPNFKKIKTLEYFFLPILFIFFFLIYTDVFSLLLLLLSFYFLLKKHYTFSGLIGFLSIIVRQNNVIWLLFFCAYLFFTEFQSIRPDALIAYFRKIWFFILSFLGVIIFLASNKGAVIGESNKLAQPLSVHFGNIFLFLFIFLILSLPLQIRNFNKTFKLVKNKFTIFFLLFFFTLYNLFFKMDHPWNGPGFNFFLRNSFFNYVLAHQGLSFLFFLLIAYSFLSLLTIKYVGRQALLLYPFSFLFLALLWLVEPRYSIIPIVFYILFKKEENLLVEYLTIGIFIILTSAIFWGTINGNFFL